MIVLDTHALVWFIDDPRRLSANARKHIDDAIGAASVCVSSITVWEIAQLVARERLVLAIDVRDWLSRVESLGFLRFVPIDNAVAVRSVFLPPPLHADPADRFIVATALALDAALITKDGKLRRYSPLRTVW